MKKVSKNSKNKQSNTKTKAIKSKDSNVQFVFSRFKDEIDGGYRYDAHYQGKNVAYVFTKPSSEGDGPWVGGLHVLPKFQGKGLGQRLMKELEKYNKGKTIRLRAKPYKGKQLNTAELVAYYTRLGYRPYDTQNRMMKKIRK